MGGAPEGMGGAPEGMGGASEGMGGGPAFMDRLYKGEATEQAMKQWQLAGVTLSQSMCVVKRSLLCQRHGP
eukprot:3352507-Amphidinium_carterae.2